MTTAKTKTGSSTRFLRFISTGVCRLSSRVIALDFVFFGVSEPPIARAITVRTRSRLSSSSLRWLRWSTVHRLRHRLHPTVVYVRDTLPRDCESARCAAGVKYATRCSADFKVPASSSLWSEDHRGIGSHPFEDRETFRRM